MRSANIKKTLLLSIAIFIGAGAWCFRHIARTPKIRNVLIISMDTTRSDYLSCYGYQQRTSPNIDALAGEGTLFENTISPIPLTLPAHSSMMTGTIPPYHGIHDNIDMNLADYNVTLAEILSEQNFKTHAIISAMVLEKQFGLDQGFQTYDDEFKNPIKDTNIAERKGEETSAVAIEWLEENKDERFFLFLHYFDPHHLYTPPEPFASKFKDVPNPGKASSRILEIRGYYAGEIAYTDHCIGQVIDKLKETDLYNSTLIIVVGDHGEMLFAQKEPTHGYFIYQAAVKVPMIFKIPGVGQPKRVKSIAGVVDITPTICSLLGISMPSKIHGEDLSEYIKGTDAITEDRAIFCESLLPTMYNANTLLGVVTDQFKYIQTTRPELYDLVNDPYERKNLIDEQPQRAKILQDRLRQILEGSVSDRNASEVTLDEEAFRVLESLGYVGGKVDEDFSFDQDKDDPKDLLVFHNNMSAMQVNLGKKQYDKAEELCKKLIKEKPELSITHFAQGKVLWHKGEHAKAIPFLEKTIELDPDYYRAYKYLAESYEDQKQFDKAIKVSHEVLKLKPDTDFLYYDLAKLYDTMGKTDMFVKYCKETIRVNPEHVKARASLINVYLPEKKIALALEQYLKLVELKPDSAKYNNAVGWFLATSGDNTLRDPEEALKYALKACELGEYKTAETFDTLAAAYASAGKFDKAVDAAKKALELANSEGKKDKITAYKKRLELYQSGRAYYE